MPDTTPTPRTDTDTDTETTLTIDRKTARACHRMLVYMVAEYDTRGSLPPRWHALVAEFEDLFEIPPERRIAAHERQMLRSAAGIKGS